jgi:hypothetical protein
MITIIMIYGMAEPGAECADAIDMIISRDNFKARVAEAIYTESSNPNEFIFEDNIAKKMIALTNAKS